jgi:hypothetical protein
VHWRQRVDHYWHVLNSGICIAMPKGFRDVTIKLASSSTLHFAPVPANFSLLFRLLCAHLLILGWQLAL